MAKQNDRGELVPLVDRMEENAGLRPIQVSADSNHCSEENLEALEESTVAAVWAPVCTVHNLLKLAAARTVCSSLSVPEMLPSPERYLRQDAIR